MEVTEYSCHIPPQELCFEQFFIDVFWHFLHLQTTANAESQSDQEYEQHNDQQGDDHRAARCV